jgi:anti-sigma factor (TIGR02949 family)
MTCEFTNTLLHGYLDGELDAARAAEFEKHLETCKDCLTALEAQESLRGAFQRARLRETAPGRLEARVRSEIGTPFPSSGFPRGLTLRWLAAAAAIVLGLLISYRVFISQAPRAGTDVEVQQILDAHLRSLQPGHLTDVTSTDQHTVKPWFTGRIDFAPPVTDFSGEGFPLEGGRVDVLNARTVAALVYGRRKHTVNVFVWPTQQADTKFAQGSERGYSWISWRRNGMEFDAISDVSVDDLRQLADLLSR